MKTQQRGETHTNAKLTQTQVDKIRALRLKTNKTYREIAEKFCISASTAMRICNGNIWK